MKFLRANLNSLLWILLIAVCASQAQAGPRKTFIYCSEDSPKIFNPQIAVEGPSINASSQTIYNRLIDFEPGGTRLIPSLAESWTVSKNEKEYIFKLRKNVAFQTTNYFTPTRDLNADDVIFSFNRMKNEKHPYHMVNGGTYEFFNSMDMGKMIQDIVKIDNLTVKFVLSRPEAAFLADLAMDFASILSEEYADQMLKAGKPERFDFEPIGTGPFRFKSYEKDTLVRYESHPKYFLGETPVQKMVFSITPDASVRYQKLKTGECDFDAQPNYIDLDRMKASAKFQVYERPGINVGYVAMNVERKPFNQLLVRRAVNYALNRKAYLKAIYLDRAERADSPLPPTQWGHTEDLIHYEYNPGLAKKLLLEAGFKNGFESELWTLPVTRPYIPNGKKLGEMIQADLAAVGIKVTLVTYKWATYLEKAAKGEHAMVMVGWIGDNADPDNFMGNLLSCSASKNGSNFARWCFEPYDVLIKKATEVSRVSEREKLYSQAQKIFSEQAPWIPLAYARVYRASREYVKGYVLSPLGHDNFYGVSLE